VAQSATKELRVDHEIDDASVFVRVDRAAGVHDVASGVPSLVVSISPPLELWSGFAGHFRLVFEAA
jgi:hypothetical protein